MQIDSSVLVLSEPFEILELDDAALFGDESINTCCPVDNADCSCWFNRWWGCGGCGDEE